MLASITPLGERGRGSKWGWTIAAFLTGATLAGAAAGALLGALGNQVLGGGVDAQVRLVVLAVALAAAALVEWRASRVPGPRRQVNERWLDEFRGWVYGAGFGAQLGLGVTTVVSSAATYVAFLASFLVGGAGRGALVLGAFGLIRGLTPLAAARVRRPDQLSALHVRLEGLRHAVANGSLLALLGMTAVAVVGSVA
jgi:MFS family permease